MEREKEVVGLSAELCFVSRDPCACSAYAAERGQVSRFSAFAASLASTGRAGSTGSGSEIAGAPG